MILPEVSRIFFRLCDELLLIAEGVQGLQKIKEKVYPTFSIELTDYEGNVILSNPNVLQKKGGGEHAPCRLN